MKNVKLFLTLLIFSFACQNDPESLQIPASSSGEPEIGKRATLSSSNLKQKLDRFASETLYRMHDVEVSPAQSRLLSKGELMEWILQNASNKSAAINAENRRILHLLLQQDDVKALRISTPNASEFQESVYVLIPSNYRVADFDNVGSILITDHYNKGEDEEETDIEVCHYQSGYDVIDLTDDTPDMDGCTPCTVECVDCDSSNADVDDCMSC